MKLSVVGPTYPYKSGISHFSTILVSHLRQHHDTDFINWKRQYPAFLYPVDPIDTNSTQTIEQPNVRLLDFWNPVSWLQAGLRVRRHGSERLVVTWVSMAQTPPYLGLLIATKLLSRRTRITFLCHNVLPHEPYFFEAFFNKLMFKLADDFIVHSSQDATDAGRLAPGKPVHIGFHPTYDDFNNGHDYSKATVKAELGLKPKVVLFFGFIRKYKGLRYLIEAMRQVTADYGNDVTLLVVGEFWKHDKPAYDALVQQFGLNGNVVFVDHFVPNEEVGKYFAVANLLVAPYVSATQSGVIQMAYAFDTPVVATNVGGLPEAVDEGVSGFLCPPQDAAALAQAITKALRYQAFDVAKTKARFTWQAYLRQVGLLD